MEHFLPNHIVNRFTDREKNTNRGSKMYFDEPYTYCIHVVDIYTYCNMIILIYLLSYDRISLPDRPESIHEIDRLINDIFRIL